MQQDKQSHVDQLHSEWRTLQSQRQPPKDPKSEKNKDLVITYILSLKSLLNKIIDAGQFITDPAGRANLQWLARDVGDLLYKYKNEYLNTYVSLSSTPKSVEPEQAIAQALWSVPHPRNEFFTGRDEVLVEIREKLTRRPGTVLVQAISGLGGIGKTQTAVEYAYRYRDEYEAVLWLDAESTLALKAGCGELARRLHLPHPENELDQAVLALKQWLATHRDWLLIFDHADYTDQLKPFLPDTGHGHILITSRAQDFQDLGIINPVQLEAWPIADATAFLLKRCGREDAEAQERDAAAQLARELDGLPLALEQAAAYIAAGNGLTIQRYLESYRSEGLKRLEARRPALGRYPRSVVSTWAANFDALQKESPAAADVLRLSAFLAPDAIPFELLIRGASECGPELGAALILQR